MGGRGWPHGEAGKCVSALDSSKLGERRRPGRASPGGEGAVSKQGNKCHPGRGATPTPTRVSRGRGATLERPARGVGEYDHPKLRRDRHDLALERRPRLVTLRAHKGRASRCRRGGGGLQSPPVTECELALLGESLEDAHHLERCLGEEGGGQTDRRRAWSGGAARVYVARYALEEPRTIPWRSHVPCLGGATAT